MALEQSQIAGLLGRMALFFGLDEEQLMFAASLMEEVRLPAMELVYEQENDPNHLYFVFEGRLQMTRYERSGKELMFGFLDPGDMFGVEMLELRMLRQSTVQSITDVVLLRIDRQKLPVLMDKIPSITGLLTMALDSFRLRLQVRPDWFDPEETIQYISRKYVLFLYVRLIPLALLSVLVLGSLIGLYSAAKLSLFLLLAGGAMLVAAAIAVWLIVDWSNDYYIITDKRVIFQERVVLLYDSRQESPMEQVQATETGKSYIGQLLGYGDVRIRTFTGLIVFQAIAQPYLVEKIVQEQVRRIQSSLRQAEIRAIEETLARRIGILPNRGAPPKSPAKKASESPLRRFIADAFHLRYEYGDTIQYRTHWFILVKRTIMQLLALLGVITGGIILFVQTLTGGIGPGFPIVAVFLVICLAGLFFLLWGLYNYLDWHNDIYLITSEQVVDINRKPLGTEQKRVAPIRNILSVEFKRIGVIGLLLNFGTVYIRVGDTEFTFDEVFNPSEVQRELFRRIAQRSLRERQQQAETERQRMADWIAAYHRLTRD